MKITRLTELNVLTGRCYGCGSIGELGIRYLGPAGSVLFVCSADCWNEHFADYLGRLDDLPDAEPADGLRCDNCDREIPDRKREHEREFCSIACINKFHTNRREASDARRLEKAVAGATIQFEWKDDPGPPACPKCGHREHGEICINADSDNDCGCTFTAAVSGDQYARDPAGPDSFGGEDFPDYPLGPPEPVEICANCGKDIKFKFTADVGGGNRVSCCSLLCKRDFEVKAAEPPATCPVCQRSIDPARRYRVGAVDICSLGCRDRLKLEIGRRETAAKIRELEIQKAGSEIAAVFRKGRDIDGPGARDRFAAQWPELFAVVSRFAGILKTK